MFKLIQAYDGEADLKVHVVRILKHMSEISRSAFPSDGHYIEEVSRLVKRIYNTGLRKIVLATKVEDTSAPFVPNDQPVLVPLSLQNLELDGIYFKQCGLGQPHDELHNIQLCMRTLGVSLQTEFPRRIRYWGRILGRGSFDYYIFEVLLKASTRYYGTTDTRTTRLVDISPLHENSTTEFYPRILEKSLEDAPTVAQLYSMIARITSDTAIALSGSYTDEYTIDSDFDSSLLKPTDPSNWVHVRKSPSRELFEPISQDEWGIKNYAGVILLTSSLWEGSNVVCYSGRVLQQYCGWGLPSGLHPLLKKQIPEVQGESVDQSEYVIGG